MTRDDWDAHVEREWEAYGDVPSRAAFADWCEENGEPDAWFQRWLAAHPFLPRCDKYSLFAPGVRFWWDEWSHGEDRPEVVLPWVLPRCLFRRLPGLASHWWTELPYLSPGEAMDALRLAMEALVDDVRAGRYPEEAAQVGALAFLLRPHHVFTPGTSAEAP